LDEIRKRNTLRKLFVKDSKSNNFDYVTDYSSSKNKKNIADEIEEEDIDDDEIATERIPISVNSHLFDQSLFQLEKGSFFLFCFLILNFLNYLALLGSTSRIKNSNFKRKKRINRIPKKIQSWKTKFPY
jgi:hypothetical protein